MKLAAKIIFDVSVAVTLVFLVCLELVGTVGGVASYAGSLMIGLVIGPMLAGVVCLPSWQRYEDQLEKK